MNIDLSTCSFPYRVYHMLERAPTAGFDHVVSWLPDGTGFKVHDKDEFVTNVMNTYFSHTKWKSFLRQLNLYDFKRLSNRGGPKVGKECSYMHPFLIRGDIDQCQKIHRANASSKNGASAKKQEKMRAMRGDLLTTFRAAPLKSSELPTGLLFSPGWNNSADEEDVDDDQEDVDDHDDHFLKQQQKSEERAVRGSPPHRQQQVVGTDEFGYLFRMPFQTKNNDNLAIGDSTLNPRLETKLFSETLVEGDDDDERKGNATRRGGPLESHFLPRGGTTPLNSSNNAASSGETGVSIPTGRGGRTIFSPDMADAIVSVFLGRREEGY